MLLSRFGFAPYIAFRPLPYPLPYPLPSSSPMAYNDNRYASTKKAYALFLGVTCQTAGKCGAPSVLGYLRGWPLPWRLASSLFSTSYLVSHLYHSSDSTNTNNGRGHARSPKGIHDRQLTTIPVDLTILLAQQETKHHEPRRPPPGTTVYTLCARQ